MRDLLIFIINFAIAYLRALSAGGAKDLAFECASLKHQIAISNGSKKRAPNLKTIDRFIFGILPFFIKEKRISKLAVILKPATILKLHKTLFLNATDLQRKLDDYMDYFNKYCTH